MQNIYAASSDTPVSRLSVDARARFILRTYVHLLGAILAFTLIEFGLFASGLALPIVETFFGVGWYVVLGAFMIVGWLATRFAHTAKSLPVQYLALGLYVVAQALFFVPLLAIANAYADGVIASAASVTVIAFIGLTAIVFVTRKNFSFLRNVIVWGGMCALIGIGASLIFGFVLGTWFSVAMVVLAGASILYDTSNVLHEYPEDRYVGASLQLFASVALLFWYVLRLFMSRD